MKQIKITPPEGYIIDNDRSTFEQIIFKKVEQSPTPHLPKSWEELNKVSGYYTSDNSSIRHATNCVINENKNIFSSEQEARASIALAQLSQLRKVYRNGWEPDWVCGKLKFFITKQGGTITGGLSYLPIYRYLSFQDKPTAELFLNNFKDLIEEASPLLFG
jgi:hypothetical protein